MVGDNELKGENMASIAAGTRGYPTQKMIGPLPLQAIVDMKKGQKAWVQFLHAGSIFSWNKRLTHFTGFLIHAD